MICDRTGHGPFPKGELYWLSTRLTGQPWMNVLQLGWNFRLEISEKWVGLIHEKRTTSSHSKPFSETTGWRKISWFVTSKISYEYTTQSPNSSWLKPFLGFIRFTKEVENVQNAELNRSSIFWNLPTILRELSKVSLGFIAQ